MYYFLQKKLKQFISVNFAAIIAVILITLSPSNAFANVNTNYCKKNAAKMLYYPTVKPVPRLVPTTSATRLRAFWSEEEEMLILINQERLEAGLPQLELDLKLVMLAREKSEDMVFHNYFGHLSDRLGSIYQQLDREKIVYQIAGENLIGAPDYRKAMKSVLASAPHRSNILNPHFKKIGIGIIKGGPYGEMITQLLTG